ncbi:hypothetical protein V491_04591, partial [Pseudogymnoascus sp. VKM F-3775]
MADFEAPPGPPPPKVPEGWKAQWNEQYKEWFYVNIYTKKSQWDKPTAPVYPPQSSAPPVGAPPSYGGATQPTSDAKVNPYDTPDATKSSVDEDARLAAQLQAEEDQRMRGQNPNYGAATPGGGYPGQSSSPFPVDQQRDGKEKKKGGLLGKLMGAASSKTSGG